MFLKLYNNVRLFLFIVYYLIYSQHGICPFTLARAEDSDSRVLYSKQAHKSIKIHTLTLTETEQK